MQRESSTWDRVFNPDNREVTSPLEASSRPTDRDVKPSAGGKRLDIQGLRAVAVVLVILSHLCNFPRGGFVGVDVFFVISGFLITGMLIRRAAQNSATAYFRQFYAARARRILPAALTVLIVTWVTAGLVFKGSRVTETHHDIFWALIFTANYHFANIGTNYFQSTRPPSAVQHYWSLSVEEQFYIVWPIIILLTILVVRRRQRWKMPALLAVAAVGSLASLAWGFHQTSANASSAYFSTAGRGWELGIGAITAIVSAGYSKTLHRVARFAGPISFLGLAGIVASALLITPTTDFPVPVGLAPTLATAVAIAAGSTGPLKWWGRLLTNRVANYLGDISYSLYLWHWPVIIFAGALLVSRSALFYALVVALVLGLAIVSYSLVERTFHSSLSDERLDLSFGRRKQALVGIALLVVGTSFYTFKPPPAVPPASSFVGSAGTPGARLPSYVASPSTDLSAQIAAAVSSIAFPSLKPDLDHLGVDAAQRDVWSKCQTLDQISPTCTFKPARSVPGRHVALVVGDSLAMSMTFTVERALVPRGWVVYGFAHGECTAADVQVGPPVVSATTAKECSRQHRILKGVVAHLRPNLVLLTNSPQSLTELAGSPSDVVTTYEKGMERTLASLVPAARTVLLSPLPFGRDLLTCDTSGATPANCLSRVSSAWRAQQEADRKAVAATGATYIDTHLWSCTESDDCPSFVGTTPVFYDGSHPTLAFSLALGPQLLTALQRRRLIG